MGFIHFNTTHKTRFDTFILLFLVMLILNREHIKKSISVLDAVKSIEDSFIAQESGNFEMPDRTHIAFGGNVLLIMPAFGGEFISTKLVSVFPDNNVKGIPSIFGSLFLSDAQTGKPLALLEGSMLTSLRTGAVGGLGVAYTTPKNATTLGLIGAGQQGFHQVLFAAFVRQITQVIVYDPYIKHIDKFTGELQNLLPHIRFVVAKNVEECIRNSEVIVTATTSEKPVVPDEPDLLRGKHFIGIGSYKPYMREFPDGLFSLIQEVVVDTPYAKKETGDLKLPLEQNLIEEDRIFTLGKLINTTNTIDTKRTTFFKSVGMALFDLFMAKTIYKNALMKDIGIKVDF